MSIDEKTLLEERKVLETDFNTTKERDVQDLWNRHLIGQKNMN